MRRCSELGWRSAGMLLALCFAVGGCPASRVGVEDTFTSSSADTSDVSRRPPEPTQIDILWVLDGSAGMCQELLSLTRGFEQFAQKLTAEGEFDIRLAAISMDAHNLTAGHGIFNNKAATNFPPACAETRVYACLDNLDCQAEFGPNWECKTTPEENIYGLNRSINTYCIYRCTSAGDCCGEFCFAEQCGPDQSCLLTMCDDAPNSGCTYECVTPGQGTSPVGCVQPPDTQDCPLSTPLVLTNETLDLFPCIATIEPLQTFTGYMEEGLNTAWLALDPEGDNAAQATGFLRPEAHLLIVFVSTEDDCSIHESFASPNYTCETHDDCLTGIGQCETDVYFSNKKGKQIKLCEGLIKKNYYNTCALLGEYKGEEHHNCAYDLDCQDCKSDEECDYGWHCKQDKKCRPWIYGLSNIATYQTPPGTPINSLSPVADFHARFKSLKSDESKVLVAAIIGDGNPVKPGNDAGEPEQDSLISSACMDNDKLEFCQAFVAANETASPGCKSDPQSEGCDEFLEVKRDCIRECFLASKGDPEKPTIAPSSYLCASDLGKVEYGGRYFKLTQMFGANGIAANICSPDGIPAALDTIADRLLDIGAH